MKHVPQTPVLLIDESIVDRNISRLAAYAKEHGIGVRPHTKTHKSIEMAHRQIAAGAMGLAVAKVGEAEEMAQASDDILMAYPAVDPTRCQRLAVLAKTKTVRVAVDSAFAVEALSAAAQKAGTVIGILVDLDVGNCRTGVQTPEAALELARKVSRLPALRLDGLFVYPGHVRAAPSEQPNPMRLISSQVQETLALWRQRGLAAPIVSGGSTPSAYQSHFIPELTEIRPGTYIYNDMRTVNDGFCDLQDCAASFVCTVVSNAVPGKVVIDAGSKTLTSDRNMASPESGYGGYVVEYPAAKVARLHEEHGELDITGCDRKPKVGERVHVIPYHICPCVNLQDIAWMRSIEDGSLRILKIDTRGKLS